MAKPPASYDSGTLLKPRKDLAARDAPADAARPAKPLRLPQRSRATTIYLHPKGKQALKIYPATQGDNTKVHDLLIQALEEWARARGINEPFRVEPLQR